MIAARPRRGAHKGGRRRVRSTVSSSSSSSLAVLPAAAVRARPHLVPMTSCLVPALSGRPRRGGLAPRRGDRRETNGIPNDEEKTKPPVAEHVRSPLRHYLAAAGIICAFAVAFGENASGHGAFTRFQRSSMFNSLNRRPP